MTHREQTRAKVLATVPRDLRTTERRPTIEGIVRLVLEAQAEAVESAIWKYGEAVLLSTDSRDQGIVSWDSLRRIAREYRKEAEGA